jgi:hypothetical protein
MKACSTCKQTLSVGEFYADHRRKDGLKSQCKACHCRSTIESRDPERHRATNREHMRRARKANPEKFRARERARHRRQGRETRARAALNNAVKRGAIVRPSCCEGCGRGGRIEGHHVDYDKPLDVRWLCTECHGKEHRHE